MTTQVGLTDSIFYVIVLIMSVVIHEFAHGYSAYLLGDDTAKLGGRLTLNPIKHLDLFGSLILPLFLIASGSSFLVGWAKPVPYNPRNLNNKKWGELIVASSGILANLLIAILFGIFIHLAPYVYGANMTGLYSFYKISTIIVFTNLVLAFFNIIPIPPLDGSKVLFSFIPYKYKNIEIFLERWGIFLLIFFIVFIWDMISPIIISIFRLITGM